MAEWVLSPRAFEDLAALIEYVSDNASAEVTDKVEADFYRAFDMLDHGMRDLPAVVRGPDLES